MQLKQCLREIYNFSYIKKLPKTSPKKQERKIKENGKQKKEIIKTGAAFNDQKRDNRDN